MRPYLESAHLAWSCIRIWEKSKDLFYHHHPPTHPPTIRKNRAFGAQHNHILKKSLLTILLSCLRIYPYHVCLFVPNLLQNSQTDGNEKILNTGKISVEKKIRIRPAVCGKTEKLVWTVVVKLHLYYTQRGSFVAGLTSNLP